MKKVISLILCVVMVLCLGVSVFADPGDQSSVPVVLTVTPATFSVTVPTSLPINVAADGTVTVSNTAYVTNLSNAPVRITNTVVTATNGWAQVSWDANSLRNEVAGTKKYALKFGAVDSYWADNTEKATQGAAIAALYADLAPTGLAGDSVNIIYSAQVAPQSSSIAGQTIAGVVFTVGWAS